jgi:hypothetical protein
MKQMSLMNKYPINALEILKEETYSQSVDDVLAHLKSKIDAHPVAVYIATFNHYAHTQSLQDGTLSSDILDAKNIICCFGKDLSNPFMLAVRPRTIGVVEMKNKFVISFMDAPNPQAHDAMVLWVNAIKKEK